MSDEAAVNTRHAAWLDAVRAQGRQARTIGFIACLGGVLVLMVGRFRLGAAPWLLWTGAAIVAVGWALFIYALARRLLWVRAHPFDPNG